MWRWQCLITTVCSFTTALDFTVQERNLKFPEGGPEASRITASCRRKLGTLGSLLDSLRSTLESGQYVGMWVLPPPLSRST